jgi:hypothetical protein
MLLPHIAATSTAAQHKPVQQDNLARQQQQNTINTPEHWLCAARQAAAPAAVHHRVPGPALAVHLEAPQHVAQRPCSTTARHRENMVSEEGPEQG